MTNMFKLLISFFTFSIILCIDERLIKTINSTLGRLQNDFKQSYILQFSDQTEKVFLNLEHFRLFRPKLEQNKIINSSENYLFLTNISFTFAVDLKVIIPHPEIEDYKKELTYKDFLFEQKYDNIIFYNRDSLVLYLKGFSDFTFYYSNKTSFAKLNYFNFFKNNLTVIDKVKDNFHQIISQNLENELDKGNIIEIDMKVILKQLENYFTDLVLDYSIGDEIVSKISINYHYYRASDKNFIAKNNTLTIKKMSIKLDILMLEPYSSHFIDVIFPLWEFSHNFTNLHFELIKYGEDTSKATMKYLIEDVYYNKLKEFHKQYFANLLNQRIS